MLGNICRASGSGHRGILNRGHKSAIAVAPGPATNQVDNNHHDYGETFHFLWNFSDCTVLMALALSFPRFMGQLYKPVSGRYTNITAVKSFGK